MLTASAITPKNGSSTLNDYSTSRIAKEADGVDVL